MRVLKVTQVYFPFLAKGGPAVKVRALAERLAQRGHQVSVWTPDHGEAKAGSLGAGDRDGNPETIYLRTMARFRTATLNPEIFSLGRHRLREFDIVHIYGLYDLLGPPVAYYCRRYGIPYVLEPMGMYRPIVRSIRLKGFYRRFLGRRMAAGASRVIATSELERQELAEEGIPPAKLVVRRNGVELPEPSPTPGDFRRQWGILPHYKVLLYLGRITPKKSPDLLLRAFARLSREEPSTLKLVLAGPEESVAYKQHLRTLIAGMGLEEQVIFTGAIFGQQKWAAYRDADVFVLPSQSENFGNTAAEAIACGTPVLVTDRCGIAPLVAPRAGCVVAYSQDAIEAALAQLLRDDGLRAQLSAGCREVARQLSWDEPVAEMEALYQQLLDEVARLATKDVKA